MMNDMLAVAVMERARDESGKFLNESDLGKTFGVRLPKAVQAKLEAIALEQGTKPTILIRQIVGEWVEENG